jgi:hypothetical protein
MQKFNLIMANIGMLPKSSCLCKILQILQPTASIVMNNSFQEKPNKNQSFPLSQSEYTMLLTMLRYIRYNKKVKYTDLAEDIGVEVEDIYSVTNQRSTGTKSILNSIKSYFDRNSIRIEEIAPLYESNIDNILSKLGLDQNIVEKSEDELVGLYLLYSSGSNNFRAITMLELSTTTEDMPLPVFRGTRVRKNAPSLNFEGFYYKVEESLFMQAHLINKPIARYIMLAPMYNGIKNISWQGFMMGASDSDSLFMTSCFMQKLSENQVNPKIVGEYEQHEFELAFPDIEEHFKSGQYNMSIPRPRGY